MTGETEERHPPSVDAIARSLAHGDLPHPLLVEAARAAIAAGDPGSASERAGNLSRALLRPVINATGVLLHTNLGRAPLGIHSEPEAWNLEFDLKTGRRGSRRVHAGSLIARATGADDVLVVNNGAAAVLLVLTVMAAGRPVIVSRGELVEIGGGFRIPEVLALSGATMIEVGTTNRTRRSDYEKALERHPDAALILKVHPSNYQIVGFTESASVAELATLGVPVLADVGSGLLDADAPWLEKGRPAWLTREPAIRQTLDQGAVAVTCSGDKLLGGPQAGIIAGSSDIIAACAKHPLVRALRPGVLVLSALQDTMLAYLRRDGGAIPFWKMATASLFDVNERASRIAAASNTDLVECRSVIGGGSLPGLEIPSAGVALEGDRSEALRQHDPPVIARVERNRTICDVRTVDAKYDDVLIAALNSLRSVG
ncbi:MAG TPA: L-seryl-tRNA(Sec) selenium transferase [Acidimicrobiales bacterium]|jgi:L-seryl-tRNA(Ser) seleniumtransferase